MTDFSWHYLAPAVPLVTRFLLAASWHRVMVKNMPEPTNERDLHRSTLLSLAGFSFTAAAGLAVLDANLKLNLQLPIWYVLVSFVAYMTALNLQAYKASYLHDQLSSALMEGGNLSLMLALITLLIGAGFPEWFQYMAGALALGSWLIDHLIRLAIECLYFRDANNRI